MYKRFKLNTMTGVMFLPLFGGLYASPPSNNQSKIKKAAHPIWDFGDGGYDWMVTRKDGSVCNEGRLLRLITIKYGLCTYLTRVAPKYSFFGHIYSMETIFNLYKQHNVALPYDEQIYYYLCNEEKELQDLEKMAPTLPQQQKPPEQKPPVVILNATLAPQSASSSGKLAYIGPVAPSAVPVLSNCPQVRKVSYRDQNGKKKKILITYCDPEVAPTLDKKSS